MSCKPVERVAKHRILLAFDRIETGEDHRLGRPVARQRFGGGICRERDRVADLQVLDDLEAGGDVTDFAGAESGDGGHRRGEIAEFQDVGFFAGAT